MMQEVNSTFLQFQPKYVKSGLVFVLTTIPQRETNRSLIYWPCFLILLYTILGRFKVYFCICNHYCFQNKKRKCMDRIKCVSLGYSKQIAGVKILYDGESLKKIS